MFFSFLEIILWMQWDSPSNTLLWHAKILVFQESYQLHCATRWYCCISFWWCSRIHFRQCTTAHQSLHQMRYTAPACGFSELVVVDEGASWSAITNHHLCNALHTVFFSRNCSTHQMIYDNINHMMLDLECVLKLPIGEPMHFTKPVSENTVLGTLPSLTDWREKGSVIDNAFLLKEGGYSSIVCMTIS